jgi:hypothetical protein
LTIRVVDTGGKRKNSSIRKILIILLGHLCIVELTYIYIFAFKFTLRYLQPYYNPIAAGAVDTGAYLPPVLLIPAANLPPVSLSPVANLPPVSTTLVKLVAKFAADAVDTSGKFTTGVVDTGGNFSARVVDTSGKFAPGVVDTGQP